MEIKPVPKIIEDIGKMVQEEKYEEACSFGLENIDLNKKYIEGEYAFKNILEEYIFQFFKKGEIIRRVPEEKLVDELMSEIGKIVSNR